MFDCLHLGRSPVPATGTPIQATPNTPPKTLQRTHDGGGEAVREFRGTSCGAFRIPFRIALASARTDCGSPMSAFRRHVHALESGTWTWSAPGSARGNT